MKTFPYFLLLMVAGLVLRIAMAAGYEPYSVPDTNTYIQAARDLVAGDFTIGQGRRTPGYPALIVLAGDQPSQMMLANLALGLAMSAVLFAITVLLTGSAGLGLAVGLVNELNLQQLFQQGTLATETLSALSVGAALLAFLSVVRQLRAGRPAWGSSLLLGLLVGFAILVRPQFLLLAVTFPALLVYAASGLRWPTRRALGSAALATAPPVAMVLAWCAVIYTQIGVFTLSTQSGFGMVNHTIDYIERAPERYAPVRDVLIRTREARIAEVGHARNTIWYAWPEIHRVTGWSLPEASRQLQRMCAEMIVHDPLRYARSVASAWVDFWTVPISWRLEGLRPAAFVEPLQSLWWIEHKLLRLSNLVMVLLVLGVTVSGRLRRAVRWDVGLTAIAATVLGSSLIQALADQGASSRYALPTQALVVLLLAVAGWRARPGAKAAGFAATRSVPPGRSASASA